MSPQPAPRLPVATQVSTKPSWLASKGSSRSGRSRRSFYCIPPTLKKIHIQILCKYLKIQDQLTASQMSSLESKLDVLKFPKLYSRCDALPSQRHPFQTWSSLVSLKSNKKGQDEIVLVGHEKVVLPEESHKHVLWIAHGNTKAVHLNLSETSKRVSAVLIF